MVNYAQIRKNMVECQLQTNNVVSSEILYAFETVPREEFVPPQTRSVAYVDEDLALGPDTFLMEPVVFARLLEAARPRHNDVVLNIGDMTGYSSAILSGLVTTVVTLEDAPQQLDTARSLWSVMDLCNIAVLQGPYGLGCAENAPYDLIILNGSVAEIPSHLLGQLAPEGRLVAVVKEPGQMGAITLVKRTFDNTFSIHRSFDAATPYLKGFTPNPTFIL